MGENILNVKLFCFLFIVFFPLISYSQSISLVYPNGNETLTVDHNHIILWNSTGIQNVNIRYSTDSGDTWITVKDTVNNTGRWDWRIPPTPSNRCRIRIADAMNDYISDISDSDFEIIPSYFTLINPNGRERLIESKYYDIRWIYSSYIVFIKIEYSTDSGSSWNIIKEYHPAKDGYYSWKVPNTPSENCRIRISDFTNSYLYDISDADFSIIPRKFVINSPNGGEVLKGGTLYNITWSGTYECNVKLSYQRSENPFWFTIVNSLPNCGGYEWKVPLNTNGSYRIKIEDVENPEIFDISDNFFSIVSFIIDGNLHFPYHTLLSMKQNNNSGSGSAADIGKLVYSFDYNRQILYLGITAKTDVYSSDGIGLFLDFSEINGAAPNTSLGGNSGGHFLGAAENPDFKADFEVDFIFAIYPVLGNELIHVDAAAFQDIRYVQHIGKCDRSGTPSSGPETAGIFGVNAVEFAFDNRGIEYTGFEMAISFSQLGVTPAGMLRAFAVIVDSTAYFTDITNPGNITEGNPGLDPDFNIIQGGPFHTLYNVLPVELISFTATVNGAEVNLQWRTGNELNNRGFEIQKLMGEDSSQQWRPVAFIKGRGTASEVTTYEYTDRQEGYSGEIRYRLKQHDYNGDFVYSPEIIINISYSREFELLQNYPNPFNSSTLIKYSVPAQSYVSVIVYDFLGREVIKLIDEEKPAGKYELKWKAANLPSGIYFYRIQTGSFVQSKKMILMK
jgi:hypothetical protein